MLYVINCVLRAPVLLQRVTGNLIIWERFNYRSWQLHLLSLLKDKLFSLTKKYYKSHCYSRSNGKRSNDFSISFGFCECNSHPSVSEYTSGKETLSSSLWKTWVMAVYKFLGNAGRKKATFLFSSPAQPFYRSNGKRPELRFRATVCTRTALI